MTTIKKYFKNWGISRVIRMILSVTLLTTYYFDRQQIYLFIGLMLGIQAVFNMACPGGACSVSSRTTKKPTMEFKKYEPNN